MPKAKPAPFPNQREEIILTILVRGEKYGRDIRNEYEARTRQPMPFGSLYTTLDRMEEKGFVTSRMGESESERGGNRRKYFKLTGEGLSSLNALRQAIAMPRGGVAHAR
jgi:PadR family transcriptional regulator PadR